MPKPIVVIYVPRDFVISPNGRDNAPMELMRALNGNFGFEDQGNIKYSDYWKDYYWFCFHKPEINAPEFQVFHEKDFTDIQYLELKQLIEDSLKQITNPQE